MSDQYVLAKTLKEREESFIGPKTGMESMDVEWCFSHKPPPLDFVIPSFVAGTVGCCAAAGSTGKSFASLQIAMGICSNLADEALLNIGAKKEGEVAIFNAEDPDTVLNERLYSISAYLPKESIELINQRLKIIPLTGMGVDILDKSWQQKVLRVGEGKRLLVFDTFTRWHRLDENSNGQMSQVVGAFEMIAKQTGAAILFLHHTNKGSAFNFEQDRQQSTRGASAIVDNCRFQSYLQVLSQDEAKDCGISDEARKMYVQLGNNKENYGTPTAAKWLKRGDGGVLLTTDEIDASKFKGGPRGGRKNDLKFAPAHSFGLKSFDKRAVIATINGIEVVNEASF